MKFKVKREGLFFEAFLGKKKIGQAVISRYKDCCLLNAIDIFDETEEGGKNYQRCGYGTKLMKVISRFLKFINIKTLKSSNEGSGTVQVLYKVFGENVKYFHGNNEISYKEAVKIMDVDFGRTGSIIKVS